MISTVYTRMAHARERTDDTAETVSERLTVYREETSPLLDYYGERSALDVVDGARGQEEVFADLRDLLVTSEATQQEVQ